MKRILYIEDDPMIMQLVRRILNSAGYAVFEATNGLEGIAMAVSEHPDLILTDINLPGISGLEVIARVKKLHSLRDVPIVAMTAATLIGDRERILASGCDAYLAKPVECNQLLAVIKNLLNSSMSA